MHNTYKCRWAGVEVGMAFDTAIAGIHTELNMDSSLYRNKSECEKNVQQNRTLFGNTWVRKSLFYLPNIINYMTIKFYKINHFVSKKNVYR